MLKKLFGPSKPKWERIHSDNLPRWVNKQMNNTWKTSGIGAEIGEVLVYRLKGKRFRYKLEYPVINNGYGGRDLGSVVAYRKPRTWYWKKMNS